MKNTLQNSEWEKKVDELYLCCGGDYCDDGSHPDDKEEIKEIIRSEKDLSYQQGRESLRREILEGINDNIPRYLKGGEIRNQYFVKGWNENRLKTLEVIKEIK